MISVVSSYRIRSSTLIEPGRIRSWLQAGTGAALFAVALWVLHRELGDVHYADVAAAVGALPRHGFAWALLLVAVSYGVLTGYDQLAFRYIGRRLDGWRVALASFVSYAVSNSVGFALISGTSVRYRFYSRWGVGAADLSRVVLFYSGTFWLGLLALGGWSLAFHPHPLLRDSAAALTVLRVAGNALIALPVGYLLASLLLRRPLRVRGLEVDLPGPGLAAGQVLLSLLDWLLAAAVLHALLPPGAPPFGVFLGAFIAGQLLGLASHVPGGVGVFEGFMLLALGDFLEPQQIISSLLLYRLVYYLLPLSVALLVLVADELRQRRQHLVRAGAVFGALSAQLAPKLLAVFTFLAGSVLLFSGALPADPGRLHWLDRWLPLAVFEASHFLGSIVGVVLLFSAQAVARRLDVGYYMAVTGLALGIAFSLLKAGDYEEAAVLTLLLLAFLPTRPEFDRHTSLFAARFSPGWTAAALAAIAASVWLGFFAFKHVEYAGDLWWQVTLSHDVSRFLRASVGAGVALLALGLARLIRPAPPEVDVPSAADLQDAERIMSAYATGTLPFLALLGDKGLLFNEDRSAFIMYGVQGRTWVALGDPVGPRAAEPELIRRFLERTDDFGGTPVFYQVPAESLSNYADVGLTVVKLGEEARVPLRDFSMAGSSQRGFRGTLNRLAREGVRFRIIPVEAVPDSLPQLREVSDEWLGHKHAAEKGFSLGFFDEAYLRRFPVGVLEVDDRIVAFANIWTGRAGQEVSIDLMRFRADAPKGAMDALFVHLMLWSRDQGFAWFSLGMAPLAGIERGPLARAWSGFAHWVFKHGEVLYNFQGVRAFKEKFHPEWEPRYLAFPGGTGLPRILADITALVAGGYRRIFTPRAHSARSADATEHPERKPLLELHR